MAASTRSLSGPVRAGASKNLGAFRLKLRLKPPSQLTGYSQRKEPRRLAFPKCRGERSEVTLPRPTACQCVSLVFRSGNTPINWRYFPTPLTGCLWHASLSKVTTIKPGLPAVLCSRSQVAGSGDYLGPEIGPISAGNGSRGARRLLFSRHHKLGRPKQGPFDLRIRETA